MFKKMITLICFTILTIGFIFHTAEAKRFGGGRSFGATRSASSFSRPSSQAHSNANHANKAQPNRSWMGPLAGLMAGGLLASLFMSHGFANGILMWLLVGGVLFLLVRWFMAKKQAQPIYHQQNATQSFMRDKVSSFMNQAQAQPQPQATAAKTYPIGFDEHDFLRQAKVMFIRMQAAYDKKDLEDIRDFTVPEVFAEIQLQCQERGNDDNHTHVISVDADLLNVESEEHHASQANMQTPFASVRFTGLIQENASEPAARFSEVWHFSKTPGNFRWLVAGIQQES